MDCPECKKEFDESLHLPRILTACGHTLCESCLKIRFKKKSVPCPQCSISTPVSTLSTLPTNLALIQLKQKKLIIDLCEKHKKPIEAFCCNDKTLVCVLCLVEDGHKSHELTTISKAAKKYRDNLSNYAVLAHSYQDTIKKEMKELNEKQNNLMFTYNKFVKDFTIVFELLKKIIIEREMMIKDKLKKTLDEEISFLNNKNTQFVNLLQNIERFKDEVQSSEEENDIDLIMKYVKREELGKNVTNRIPATQKPDPFQNFSAEIEVNTVIKLIQSRFFKPELKSTPTLNKKKPLTTPKDSQPRSKLSAKPSNKTIPKPISSLDWDNISAISRAHSDEDTLSMKSFDFNLLNRVQNTKIFTISGFSEKAVASVELYESLTDTWTNLPDCSAPRTQFASLFYMNSLLIMGGKQNGKRVSSCEQFNFNTNTWNTSSICLPAGRSGFSAIGLSNDIYVIGGSDGSVLGTFQSFNMNEWISLPSLNCKRDELAGVVGPDLNIYAIGGFGGDSQVLNSCEMFTIETEKWEKIPNLSCPRRALAAVTLPDGIYVIGGYNGSSYLKDVEKYEHRMKKWIPLTPLNHPRCTLTACASIDCQYIYAIGGFNGSPLNVVERYSLLDNKWETVAPLQTERFMHCSVVSNEFF